MLSKIANTLFYLFLTCLFGISSFAQNNTNFEKKELQAQQDRVESIRRNIEILKNGKDDVEICENLKEFERNFDNARRRDFLIIDYSQAVPILKDILKRNNNKCVLAWTIRVLSLIDSENIVPVFNEILKTNPDEDVLVSAIDSLRYVDQKTQLDGVIPQLIEILKTSKNRKVLAISVNIIGYVGKPAKDSVPYLVEILKATNETQKTREDEDFLHAIISTLGLMGENAKDSIPALVEILSKSQNKNTVSAIESAFGQMGTAAKDTAPVLLKILGEKQVILDKYKNSRFKFSSEAQDIDFEMYALGGNIEEILNALISDREFSNVNSIDKTFRENFKEPYGTWTKKVYDKIQVLKELKTKQDSEDRTIITQLKEHYVISLLAILFILNFSLWLLIYSTKPLWLVSFHEYLWRNSLLVNFKYIAEFSIIPFLSLICLRPRALDAWIKSNLETVKTNFESKETIKERNIHVPVKVTFKGNDNTDFISENVREVFEKNQTQLLIFGDGGSGKTSLVCQLAQLAINGSLFNGRKAFPVFLEEDFENAQMEIKKKIKELLTSENNNNSTFDTISDALQKELLKTKRILVIVDGVSELNESTKNQVRDNTDINAVVYTSRNNEIKDVSKIETNNVAPENLYYFISEFIEKSIGNEEKESLFEPGELFTYCEKLSKLVGEKGISVLMAKLYAEQMVTQKTESVKEVLPNNVPDLMIQSIKILHKKTPSENLEFSEIIKTSKIIAYESLKEDYRPMPVSKRYIEKVLKKVKNNDETLMYLLDKLKVIETKGIEEDKIAFKIDPLAEYLAASYLVDENSNNKMKWKNAIKDMQRKSIKNNIKGFLVAVIDCCELNTKVPKDVFNEIKNIRLASDVTDE